MFCSIKALLKEHLPVSDGRVLCDTDLGIAETCVEARSLEGVGVDPHDNASATDRLVFGRFHQPGAEAVVAVVAVDPQPFDHRVTTPREPVKAGDELTGLITEEAAERGPVGVSGRLDVEPDHCVP